MSKARLLSCIFVSSLFFIFIDQISKYIIRRSGGFYLCNPGIAWGINVPEWLFWIFWTAIIFFILYLIRENSHKEIPNKLHFFALTLLLSGALGNFADRLFFGCVIDFIDLKLWPVFNLADAYITIGAILILMRILNFSKNN